MEKDKINVNYEYKEKDQEILNMDFVVVSYMIIGGDHQATQIYVGMDCPDKSYLNTMAIQLSGNLHNILTAMSGRIMDYL